MAISTATSIIEWGQQSASLIHLSSDRRHFSVHVAAMPQRNHRLGRRHLSRGIIRA